MSLLLCFRILRDPTFQFPIWIESCYKLLLLSDKKIHSRSAVLKYEVCLSLPAGFQTHPTAPPILSAEENFSPNTGADFLVGRNSGSHHMQVELVHSNNSESSKCHHKMEHKSRRTFLSPPKFPAEHPSNPM